MKTAGLHHITAVTRDLQTNIDFYQQVLGQRLVKTTVNFDDPGAYHLYYGDYTGVPGTAMTFFGWLNTVPGKVGSGRNPGRGLQHPTAFGGILECASQADGILARTR